MKREETSKAYCKQKKQYAKIKLIKSQNVELEFHEARRQREEASQGMINLCLGADCNWERNNRKRFSLKEFAY